MYSMDFSNRDSSTFAMSTKAPLSSKVLERPYRRISKSHGSGVEMPQTPCAPILFSFLFLMVEKYSNYRKAQLILPLAKLANGSLKRVNSERRTLAEICERRIRGNKPRTVYLLPSSDLMAIGGYCFGSWIYVSHCRFLICCPRLSASPSLERTMYRNGCILDVV
ncbi:uncharacterized protein F4807DRAFT_88549 [Annulohypoxylon truncatum]|uniref:uncharacterized protein n=1 Tax=Annulohypoxylon truncatum TaxID=327061 RepID=UPI002007859B|nr:uncharacterized protein F4807DRAFT_88549 [Annulohypoxylon truncatum]KAI1209735.1 hypothetical protein F4807DRAFT_88549 [Annulohypoxylon truncatum]